MKQTDIKKDLLLTEGAIQKLYKEWLFDGSEFNNNQHKHMTFFEVVAQAQLHAIFNDPRVVVLEDDQSLPLEIDKFRGQVRRVLHQAGFKRVRRV